MVLNLTNKSLIKNNVFYLSEFMRQNSQFAGSFLKCQLQSSLSQPQTSSITGSGVAEQQCWYTEMLQCNVIVTSSILTTSSHTFLVLYSGPYFLGLYLPGVAAEAGPITGAPANPHGRSTWNCSILASG